VTEWEVKSAFQDEDREKSFDSKLVISDHLRKKAIWSHRQILASSLDDEDAKKD
jgi:hypothetical protein